MAKLESEAKEALLPLGYVLPMDLQCHTVEGSDGVLVDDSSVSAVWMDTGAVSVVGREWSSVRYVSIAMNMHGTTFPRFLELTVPFL